MRSFSPSSHSAVTDAPHDRRHVLDLAVAANGRARPRHAPMTEVVWARVTAGGRALDRTVVRTRWFEQGEELHDVVREAVGGLIRADDTVFVSEKLVVLLTGRTVPVDAVHPGPLAELLVGFVRPRPGSRGLAVPEKMQYVLDRAGRPRVLVAAAISGLTRPFGWHGLFYRVAGSLARDLDGGRPPYEHLLFPPLDRADGRVVANLLADHLGVAVAIVDLNDFGGTIRATSVSAPSPRDLHALLADNPLGQRAASTPIGILRPVTD